MKANLMPDVNRQLLCAYVLTRSLCQLQTSQYVVFTDCFHRPQMIRNNFFSVFETLTES